MLAILLLPLLLVSSRVVTSSSEEKDFVIAQPTNVVSLSKLAAFYFDPTSDMKRVPSGLLEEESFARHLETFSVGDAQDPFFLMNDIVREVLLERIGRSRTVSGKSNGLYWHRFVEKLSTGTCTNILLLGGSLTCGHGVEDGQGWAHLVRKFLNQLFPCYIQTATEIFDEPLELLHSSHLLEIHSFNKKKSKIRTPGVHQVINRCQPATGSMHAATEFQRLVCDIKSSVDLVIMEFASNDLVDNVDTLNMTDSSPQLIEFLIRKFDYMSIPQLFFQGSFRFSEETAPNFITAEPVHLPVQKYYDVPTVSLPAAMREMFLRNDNWNNSESKYFKSYLFLDEHSHQTTFGHSLLAYVLLWNFQNDVHHWVIQNTSLVPRIDVANTPLFATGEVHLTLLNGRRAKTYNFAKWIADFSGVTMLGNWTHNDENRGKWGLVSEVPGSELTFSVTDSHVFLVSIGFLRSYEKMGKFSIHFDSSDSTSKACQISGNDVEFKILECQRYVMDGLWSSQTSQIFPVLFKVPSGTSRVFLKVLNASDSSVSKSRGSKVKIVSVNLFVPGAVCVAEFWWENSRLPMRRIPSLIFNQSLELLLSRSRVNNASNEEEQSLPGFDLDVQTESAMVQLPHLAEHAASSVIISRTRNEEILSISMPIFAVGLLTYIYRVRNRRRMESRSTT
eukprot:TRINITY_DN6480_c0_g1_i4.p1 TRINITY_DN6480_c0_g1~~TRINITY_DN6480_c0_g1_i4.p1  ORF type:complete len:674 (-),score=135.61 TRINITY_DN6480_c0_g1_i4:80-2101(-)